MHTCTFRGAGAADWPAVAELLTAAQLPLDGAADQIDGFLLALQDGALIGTAALERYGDAALLRSVAVAASGRGAGLGQELVRRLLGQAQAAGVRTVVLLTTTAAGFFPRFGFRTVTRADVPAALQASAEFRGACPATATVMRLDLAGR